jgi:hypothetical protein
MINRLCLTLGLLLAAGAFSQGGRTIQVDVTYAGSGTVDASHKIFIALWDSGDMSGGPPVAVQSLESKKGTVSFTNAPKPAYISAAYDPTGRWDAQSPPPSGSSLGMYSSKPPTPEPINAEPGKPARVKLMFDDTTKTP